ncbi:hypothetical protein [Aquimarina brevivitae]|uniref:Uncharacterized protein n=1 Tax=Aquimarina brevivitae TaxID=323412 RepID=A0A4Q7P2E1_9FLAO|nr:hypothetical protein [Aquimarina brevivitae]RZS93550.1 hypothetical protein EV197_2130 [Aquimarina brevivitae]
MKILPFAMLFLVSIAVIAQQKAKIKELYTDQKAFSIIIGEEEAELYLVAQNTVDKNPETYLVKGWYNTNNNKPKKDLVGIYSKDRLVLYHFNDKTRSSNFLSQELKQQDQSITLSEYFNLSNFSEKITLTADTKNWTNNKATKNINLSDQDLEIRKSKKYLLFGNGGLDLSFIGADNWEYEIIASSPTTIILAYNYRSNTTGKGRCAAGTESGFIALNFDKTNTLQEKERYIKESCLFSIEAQNDKEPTKETVVYTCANFMSGETYTLTLNTAAATIVKNQ